MAACEKMLVARQKPSSTGAHRPSSHGVATVQMKNWLPLVSLPELAMDRMPGASCFRLKSSSCARARLLRLLGQDSCHTHARLLQGCSGVISTG